MTNIDRRAAIIDEIVKRTGIDAAMIDQLVRAFYAKVREDALLGPIFDARITDWETHLQRMCAFWSSVALMTGHYHGQPMEKHLPLPVDGRHFDRWLALFVETAGEICPPVAAEHFTERAKRIAQSLELGIAGQNGIFLMKDQRLRRPDSDVYLPDDDCQQEMHDETPPHDDETPVRAYASPPCFMHELDPDFVMITDTADRPRPVTTSEHHAKKAR